MDLILWRHCVAEDGERDADRALTAEGREHAARIGGWLRARLPRGFRAVSSPARRARETAAGLGSLYDVSKRMAPGAKPEKILDAFDWPSSDETLVVVGHQPELGRLIALLVSGREDDWHVEKGGLWWLRGRPRRRATEVRVRAVVSPDLAVALRARR
jgi:phosphohistidine phosphatase